MFWHAKGVSPIHNSFMPYTGGVQIVPLNMAEPVLFIKGERNATNRGFAPHGPGRNMNRTMHKKLMADRTNEEIFNTETQGLDARFYSGNIDISELPSAYKNAESVDQRFLSSKLFRDSSSAQLNQATPASNMVYSNSDLHQRRYNDCHPLPLRDR